MDEGRMGKEGWKVVSPSRRDVLSLICYFLIFDSTHTRFEMTCFAPNTRVLR